MQSDDTPPYPLSAQHALAPEQVVGQLRKIPQFSGVSPDALRTLYSE